MCDRLAVGELRRRAFCVDVYPLVIARGLGKLVDPILIDNDPVGQADLLALERFRVFN